MGLEINDGEITLDGLRVTGTLVGQHKQGEPRIIPRIIIHHEDGSSERIEGSFEPGGNVVFSYQGNTYRLASKMLVKQRPFETRYYHRTHRRI